MSLRHSFAAVCLLAASLGAASSAEAQTVINSVPYTISVSGKYVLANNFITASASQTAITINVSNVILDLNGFFLSGPGSTPASTTAVISVGNVSNVTVRNGTVANNGYGIFFASGVNNLNQLVENVNATRCYVGGIYVASISPGTVIRQNTISQIGSASGGSGFCYGIYTFGGVRIENNVIVSVTATGSGTSYGINSDTGSFTVGNTISNALVGIKYSKYQNNLTEGCATPFQFGTDAGGNNGTSPQTDRPVAKP